jgi:hypothetical protein
MKPVGLMNRVPSLFKKKPNASFAAFEKATESAAAAGFPAKGLTAPKRSENAEAKIAEAAGE